MPSHKRKKTSVPRLNSRQLSNNLRELGAEVHDFIVDAAGEGEAITKAEALARLLWKKALGYTETKKDDEGMDREVIHAPEAWAIQLVYDRLEGKTPMAINEDETRVKAVDRVREMATKRLNAMAAKAMSPAGGPPKLPKKDTL